MSQTLSRRMLLKTSGIAGLTTYFSVTAAAQVKNREVWVFDVGDLVVSSPTVVGDMLYIGSNGSNIYAINKSTGEQQWVFETDGFVNSSPEVVEDTLYIGSNDNKLYAINRNTGEEKWQFNTGDKIRSSPTYADGTVFIGNGDFRDPVDTSVYAINANTGEQQWRYETEDRVSSAPVVDNNNVFVTSTDGNIYALNRDTGSLIWSKNVGAGRSSPTVVDETVFVVGYPGIFALDKETGDEKWVKEINVEYTPSSSPTVANGTLYVGLTSKNLVSAIDVESGNEVWSFQTGNVITSSPTYVNETIFIGSDDGYVYSIDTDTGEEQWRFSVGDEVHSSPIVVDGTLYIGSVKRDPYGGSVYALKTDVNGSSNGSRADLGTLGHNQIDSKASKRGSNSVLTQFQQFYQDAGSDVLLGLIAISGIGGAFVGYRKYTGDDHDESHNNTDSLTTHTEDQTKENFEGVTVSSYDEITTQTTVEQKQRYTLKNATIDGEQIWVVTPPGDDTTTISTDVIEQFTQVSDHWEGIKPHPNVLSVYGTGMASVPWLVVEKPAGSLLQAQADTLTTDALIAALQQVCDGLHHVSRYGSPYKHLTTESIYYADGDVSLRGVLDEFESEAPWYNAPEEFDGDVTEQTLVYRLGVVVYELLTGTLPYADYPTADPKQAIETNQISPPSEQVSDLPAAVDEVLLKALSKDIEDRFETVLHFRDRLGEVC